MEGRILADTWVIDRALGSGGMGAVYAAHNVHAPRIRAAIKLLHPRLLDGESRRRFVLEAELLANLDHPHVVKVRNLRLDDELPFLEMQLVTADNLLQHMGGSALPVDEALVLFEQLVSAVRYLHRQGIAHRDIKPANLLIRPGPRLTLVDFGLAVEHQRPDPDEAAPPIGTVAYAPPEWLTPAQLDPASWDLYAAGVVLHEMLTGEPPFAVHGPSDGKQAALAVMAAKLELPFLDPGDRVPEPLRALVRELTARDPSERLGPAREVAHRVQQVQEALRIVPAQVLARDLSGDALRQAEALRQLEATRDDTEHAPTRQLRDTPSLVQPAPRALVGPPPVARVVVALTAALVAGMALAWLLAG
jgi:serine/threonine-protein kinase